MIEPMVIAGFGILLLIIYAIVQVYRAYASFQARHGSYEPIMPSWMKWFK